MPDHQGGLFLSYVHEDRDRVHQLYQKLQQKGYRVWFDERGLVPGDLWEREIETTIKSISLILFCLSNRALEKEGYFQTEIKLALERKRRMPAHRVFIIPVLLESCRIPAEMNDCQAASLFQDDGFEVLCQALDKHGDASCRESPAPAKNDLFRVLLLATETDLGETRRRVAEHLTRFLACQVSEHGVDEVSDPNEFDAVVLLQALRSEGGGLMEIFEKAAANRRALFALDEQADWPPHRLIEFDANPKIQAFLERHKDQLQTYQDPKDLAEPVTRAIETIRKATRPETEGDTGLRDYERAYLEFRWETWSRGNAGRRTFCSQDFYRPELYVPLDGVASGWRLDDSGRLQKVKPKRGGKGREAMLGEAKGAASLRLPLARWASESSLSWLTLAGAPGAGKTVFLTRLAAQLAALWLGRRLDTKGEVTPAFHSPGTERPPIPIVLEARALNVVGQAGFDALLQAVRKELASAPCKGLPDEAQLRVDLSGGRYLLLLDALDEIAEAHQREAVLNGLKNLKTGLPGTRLVLTTRSARYTGPLSFTPAFEVVEVAHLDNQGIENLCRRFSESAERDRGFEARLTAAVAELVAHTDKGDTESLAANPLLLTAICMIFQTGERLPEDREELCELLVEDLCRARESKDESSGFELNAREKRDLLEQLALAMQQDGSQSLALEKVKDLLADHLPYAGKGRDRETSLQWLAVHTGLLYFEGDASGGERLRFHHRLLREYLAASALAGTNQTAEALAAEVYEKGWLMNGFWEDVWRMLPAALGGSDRAMGWLKALKDLAEKHTEQAGRILGHRAAAVVENQMLEKKLNQADLAAELVAAMDEHGKTWSPGNSIFLLTQVGKLGDPRLNPQDETYWVFHPSDEFTMGDDNSQKDFEKPAHKVKLTEPFRFGRYPVTNQEYAKFIDDRGYEEKAWWCDDGWRWLHLKGDAFEAWFEDVVKLWLVYKNFQDNCRPSQTPLFWGDKQFKGTNQPVVGVSWFEADAYCRWLSNHMAGSAAWFPEGAAVVLPSEAQWEFSARGADARVYPWEKASVDHSLANYDEKVGQTTPVGAYPKGVGPKGCFDLAGNVWEWCRDPWEADYKRRQKGITNPEGQGDMEIRVSRGGSWASVADNMRAACRIWYGRWSRDGDLGFRCCLDKRPETRGQRQEARGK